MTFLFPTWQCFSYFFAKHHKTVGFGIKGMLFYGILQKRTQYVTKFSMASDSTYLAMKTGFRTQHMGTQYLTLMCQPCAIYCRFFFVENDYKILCSLYIHTVYVGCAIQM